MMEKSITFAEIRIPESLFINPAKFFLSQCIYSSSVGVALAATKGAAFRKSAATIQRIAHEAGIFKPQRGFRQQDALRVEKRSLTCVLILARRVRALIWLGPPLLDTVRFFIELHI